ncbi:hypothetical protein WDZ92_51560 [Nostoc sp. NIES-2111]
MNKKPLPSGVRTTARPSLMARTVPTNTCFWRPEETISHPHRVLVFRPNDRNLIGQAVLVMIARLLDDHGLAPCNLFGHQGIAEDTAPSAVGADHEYPTPGNFHRQKTLRHRRGMQDRDRRRPIVLRKIDQSPAGDHLALRLSRNADLADALPS